MEIEINEILNKACSTVRWAQCASASNYELIKQAILKPMKLWASDNIQPSMKSFMESWNEICKKSLLEKEVISNGILIIEDFLEWAIQQGKPRAVLLPFSVNLASESFGEEVKIIGNIDLIYSKGNHLVIPKLVKLTNKSKATRTTGSQNYELTAWHIAVSKMFAISPQMMYYILDDQRLDTQETRRSVAQIDNFYKDTLAICSSIKQNIVYHNYGWHCDSCQLKLDCQKDAVKSKGDPNAEI
jgi:hypothetical protein